MVRKCAVHMSIQHSSGANGLAFYASPAPQKTFASYLRKSRAIWRILHAIYVLPVLWNRRRSPHTSGIVHRALRLGRPASCSWQFASVPRSGAHDPCYLCEGRRLRHRRGCPHVSPSNGVTKSHCVRNVVLTGDRLHPHWRRAVRRQGHDGRRVTRRSQNTELPMRHN